MNLADAIRQAAQRGLVEPGSTPATGVAATPVPQHEFDLPTPAPAPPTEAAAPAFAVDAVTQAKVPLPDEPSLSVRSGQVIRLELFMPPEQLSQLFRSIMTAQHSMLTLRETAQYLRVAPQVIETMAKDGEIPAVMIDGRWRFPKSSLDEWLSVQAFKTPSEENHAA